MTEFEDFHFMNHTNTTINASHDIETLHFDVLTAAVRQLNRLVLSYQFSLGESLRNGENYWFTVRDSEMLFKLSDLIRPASKALYKEIEQNLEILYVSDSVDRRSLSSIYYGQLLNYRTSVDSFSANVHSLTLAMNGLYGPIDEIDEDDIKDTCDQFPVATGIYLDILKTVKLEVEVTKTIIFSNTQINSDLKNGYDIDVAVSAGIAGTAEIATALDISNDKPIYSWKGDKTDIAELLWALTKSNRIIDNATGQPVTQIALVRQLESLLGIKLDVPGLMKGRMSTYKMNNDGKSFTATLQELVNERSASR